ncbi:hypothetical protein BDV96DRAFT_666745 [Lophiotrema nucula]|uniref:RING-type domain-containing protein n=1 Tax=Lophiotrema nucula TaxID=690887 RepID=A0A6A5YWP3_9PLEO|nr:hypothetical protein BDV96DRAFT_666745 [Lophiotrema nucula]
MAQLWNPTSALQLQDAETRSKCYGCNSRGYPCEKRIARYERGMRAGYLEELGRIQPNQGPRQELVEHMYKIAEEGFCRYHHNQRDAAVQKWMGVLDLHFPPAAVQQPQQLAQQQQVHTAHQYDYRYSLPPVQQTPAANGIAQQHSTYNYNPAALQQPAYHSSYTPHHPPIVPHNPQPVHAQNQAYLHVHSHSPPITLAQQQQQQPFHNLSGLNLQNDASFSDLMLRYDAYCNSINPPAFTQEEIEYFEFLRRDHQPAQQQTHNSPPIHPDQQVHATPTQQQPKIVTRLPVDADCPICYDPMHPSSEQQLDWCKHGCGKSWHQPCINKWANSHGGALQNRKGVPCPLCRAQVPGPFGSDVEPEARETRTGGRAAVLAGMGIGNSREWVERIVEELFDWEGDMEENEAVMEELRGQLEEVRRWVQGGW